MACARPISPPSTVTAELLDMFCALNGATRTPLRASRRHSPATTIDLPASELVPATSSAPVTKSPSVNLTTLSRRACSHDRQDLGAVVGDHQRVFKLRGPLAVLGGDRPAVIPGSSTVATDGWS